MKKLSIQNEEMHYIGVDTVLYHHPSVQQRNRDNCTLKLSRHLREIFMFGFFIYETTLHLILSSLCIDGRRVATMYHSDNYYFVLWFGDGVVFGDLSITIHA